MVTSIILAGLATILLLIPLPYGAVDEWAIFVFEVTVASLFLLYAFYSYSPRAKRKKYGDEEVKKLQERTSADHKASAKDKNLIDKNLLDKQLSDKNLLDKRLKLLEEESRVKGCPKGWLKGKHRHLSNPLPYPPVDYWDDPVKANVVSRIVFSLVIIFFLISFLQIIPWPLSVVRALSPEKLAIHQASASVLEGLRSVQSGGQKSGLIPLSLVPLLSWYEILKYISYFLFAILLYKVAKSRREIQIFVLVILATGLFQAIYGLAEYLSGTNRIFGYRNIWGRGSAFGTFINRDHYAGFLEMVFPLSLGFLLARANFFALKKGVSFRQKIVWFSQEKLQQVLLLGALATVLGLGLLFSRSRSGVIIFVIIFFLMMLALSMGAGEEMRPRKQSIDKFEDKFESERKEDDSFCELKEGQKEFSFGNDNKSQRPFGAGFRSKKRCSGAKNHFPGNPGSRRMLRLIRTVALAVVFIAIYIGIKPIIERFTLESFWRETRPKFYELTMRMIADYPLFGTGAGTYIYAYTSYEREDFRGILHHAHNDYLETLAEMGLIGGGAIILTAFFAFGFLLWRWQKLQEREYFRRGVGLGLLSGIMAILIHSVSDFNLRIPANLVYFLSFYVLAWRLLCESPQKSKYEK